MCAKFVTFQTDGAAKSGTATEELTGLSFMQEERGVAIIDITQVSCGTLANDADWQLWIDGMATRFKWSAEELDPASVGRNRLLSPIRIHPRAKIQWKWTGQTAAAANNLRIQYQEI